jgi:GT2 family glycosyltransferase
MVSVVVCAYEAADTIDGCLASLARLTYPDVEIIVVNDGSRDATGEIARSHPGVRVLDVEHGGLSAARNAGLGAATGEIVAYTDADVRVDPDWLTYLVQPMLRAGVVGAGGPNVVPPEDAWGSQCVARAPGGPMHVMLDDRIAEHVPGCNMAFRRDALLAVGGFNPVYVRAGDDVDICWRLQARKLDIGFAPAALVWHHHRSDVTSFWRQQVGYGEAEAWLDAHHPEKFLGGNMAWRGRLYSPLPFLRGAGERRVNTGVWGTAAFPSVYSTSAHPWHYLPHSPAWMIASFLLFNIGFWGPLAGMDAAWLPLIAGTLGGLVTLTRCLQHAWRSDLRGVPALPGRSLAWSRLRCRALIAWLHVLQPLARLRGRLRGMSQPPSPTPTHMTGRPWRAPTPSLGDALRCMRLVAPGGSERSFWSPTWVQPAAVLTDLVGVLRAARPARVVEVDEGWRLDQDLGVAVGRWGWLRVLTLMEEHKGGACLLRVRARLRPSFAGTLRGATLAILVAGGMSASIFIYDLAETVLVAGLAIAALGARTAWQAIRGVAVLDRAIDRVTRGAGLEPLEVASGGVAVDVPVRESTVEAGSAPAFEPHVEPALRRTAGAPSARLEGTPR